jgi:hypothetical protein
VRWRTQPAHLPRSVRHLGRRPRMPAPRRAISGPCCLDGNKLRLLESLPLVCPSCGADTCLPVGRCVSSRSSPRPRPSSRSSWLSVSRHVHPRSRPHADRPPGTMLPSRCRSGTCSPSPRPTSSLISAYPGSRPLLPQRVPPPLSPGGSLPRRSRHGNQERPRLQRSRRPPAPPPRVDGPSRPR